MVKEFQNYDLYGDFSRLNGGEQGVRLAAEKNLKLGFIAGQVGRLARLPQYWFRRPELGLGCR